MYMFNFDSNRNHMCIVVLNSNSLLILCEIAEAVEDYCEGSVKDRINGAGTMGDV